MIFLITLDITFNFYENPYNEPEFIAGKFTKDTLEEAETYFNSIMESIRKDWGNTDAYNEIHSISLTPLDSFLNNIKEA